MSETSIQLFKFFITGIIVVSIDFASYFYFLNFLSIDLSKGISFFLGTLVAFMLNKYWTFSNYQESSKQLLYFFILYFFTLFINISTNKIILVLSDKTLISFIIATGSSAGLNFIGQKWVIFKTN